MPKAEPKGGAARGSAVQRAAMRPALGLDELLELLVQHRVLEESQAREVAGRATTLRSSVLKERVGSVRSQAAARYVVSAKCDILAIIDRVYGFRSKVSQAQAQLGEGVRGGALVQLVELRSNAELAATSNDEHVVAAVDYLLNYAFEQRASDLHLEPRAKDAVIRFRIDGILHDIETMPLPVHGAVVSRIKVLAGM